jgi:hypothetical protein
MADLITATNQKIAGSFSFSGIMNSVGWLIVGIIVIAAIGGGFWWWWTRKQFNKNITDFELIGDHYEPTYRDTAKMVKLGSGGFQVIYLRKAKTYRIAYGKRVGRNNYYFFIAPDGYPYNGMLGRNITTDGRTPIITTNPSMRAQYTALEKQIDHLHGEKKGFWDKYGSWVLSIGFVVIIGMFGYLYYGQMKDTMGVFPTLIDKLSVLTESINKLLVSSCDINAAGTAQIATG